MILSNNAFNWAMLRSGMGMGDFIASLSPEREAELFKAYNEWRRSRGLPEEKMQTTAPAPTATATPAAPEQRKESAPVDDLSTMFTQVAAEVEEEEAEETALVQNALDGADEIVEETEPVPEEVEEEIEAEEPMEDDLDEPAQEDEAAEADEPEASGTMDTEVDASPEVVTTPAVADEPDVPAAPEAPVVAEPAVDFATIIRSLPKEADPTLYSRIKDQYGSETLPMVQAALKEATAKHRTTAAIRAFIAWLSKENN